MKTDTDKHIQVLNIEKMALEAASDELPPSDSIEPDANEGKIAIYFNKLITAVKEAYDKNTRNYNIRLQNINQKLKKLFEDIENISETFQAEIVSLKASRLKEINNLRTKYNEVSEDLENFKIENQIQRNPSYPSSRFLLFSIIVFILVIESVINGITFAEGSEFGLVGGISQALLIAFINVLIGGVIGFWGIREINHNKQKRKIIGIVSLCFFIIWVGIYNLIVAHYRDNFVTLDSDLEAGKASINSILTSTTDLSFNSMILFIIGIVCSTVALYDALKMDDFFPGYGSRARKVDLVKNDLDYMKKKAFVDTGNLREKALKTINVDEQRTSAFLSESNTIQQNRAIEIEKTRNEIDHLNRTFTVLVKMYREKNIKHRDSSEPPFFKSKIDYLFDINSLGEKTMDNEIQTPDAVESLFRKKEIEIQKKYQQEINLFNEILK